MKRDAFRVLIDGGFRFGKMIFRWLDNCAWCRHADGLVEPFVENGGIKDCGSHC